MKPTIKLHYIILFLFVFLFATQVVSAQGKYRITGEVVDSSTGKGVGFATVSLADSTSVPFAAWACDGNGKFDYTVKTPGKYKITVASLGYTSAVQDVTIDQAVTKLEKISLDAGINIETVAVTTTKPLIKSDIDKIAYSVEADPEASVSTVLDILRKVPLVTVDAEDNVQLQGQSNYKVLVNGKSSSLMDRNFKEVVRGMPANSIKDIEVITNPSSKYEAEGVGGIINIITNRARISGYNGSIGMSADNYGGLSGNGYLNAKFGKFSVSGNINGGLYPRPSSSYESYQLNKLSEEYRYTTLDSRSSSENKNLSYQLEASYEIDTFNLVSLSMWGYSGGYDSKSNSTSSTYDIEDLLVRQYLNTNKSNGSYGGLSGNIDYQRIFMKPGKTFTVSYKIDNSPNDSKYTSVIDGILDYNSYQQRSINDTWSREQTVQIDYVDPLTEKHSIEAGTKFILRQNGSDPQTYDRQSDDDDWVLNPARKNALDYDQYIWGLYGSYTFKLKKFSTKAGARLETTWNDGVFKNAFKDTDFDNQLFNVIPYINFSYAPKQSDRYTLSYTQRLSRPGIWYLNPYVNDADPMNISFGNPDLESEISHTINASYGVFGPKVSFTIGANGAFVNNSIERVTEVDSDGRSISTYYNIGKRENYGLNGYYSYRPSGKFSINLNASAAYTLVEDSKGEGNEGFNYNGSANVRVSVWKNATASANIFYNSPRISLQGESSGFYYYGLSLNQRAFKNKVSFNLSATNPFNKYMKHWSELDTETFYSRSDMNFPMRNFRLNVTWNFGKTQVEVKKARRGISNDDVKAGESSSGGGAQ